MEVGMGEAQRNNQRHKQQPSAQPIEAGNSLYRL